MSFKRQRMIGTQTTADKETQTPGSPIQQKKRKTCRKKTQTSGLPSQGFPGESRSHLIGDAATGNPVSVTKIHLHDVSTPCRCGPESTDVRRLDHQERQQTTARLPRFLATAVANNGAALDPSLPLGKLAFPGTMAIQPTNSTS